MKYLLTFIVEEGGMEDVSSEEMREVMARWNAFNAEAAEAGALIACEPLDSSSNATTIRVGEDGTRTATDGPFAESKEQLGGFCLLECAGQEEALEWAGRAPLGAGSIEVRAVADLSAHGYESPTREPAKATP